MLARVNTASLFGIDAAPIEVEAQVSDQGTRLFSIIGLGDTTVKESRERIFAALHCSGFWMPRKVLINLAPAEIKKEGSSFDLPIALSILVASGQLPATSLKKISVHGELSLDGSIKPIRGVISMVISALQNGSTRVILPSANATEGALIEGIDIIGTGSLVEAVQILRGEVSPQPRQKFDEGRSIITRDISLADVWGQRQAKRAMTIAAAGGHNLLMIGPPGCGKSMLAERFRTLLPPLRKEEILEAAKIHSVAGLPIHGVLRGIRPYRSPHHVISDVGLVGGGSMPRPGEISLAHTGVLFLDEFPEFRRSALEALRAPLESRVVRISRARASLEFPSSFQLLAAMNPCPCGRLGDKGRSCACSFTSIRNYLSKLSQPLLDRIDLHVELESVPLSAMVGRISEGRGEVATWIESIALARNRAISRIGCLNAALDGGELKRIVSLKPECVSLMEKVAGKYGLTARTYTKVIKVALTIADLSGEDNISKQHISEAVSFRSLERINQYLGQSALSGIEKNIASS